VTRVLCLDLNTTGLFCGHDDIVEIGIAELTCPYPVQTSYTHAGSPHPPPAALTFRGALWHTLVNPRAPMSDGAARVHGLAPDLLRTAPGFAQIAPALREQLGGAHLVIHNAPLDVGFLQHSLARYGCGWSLCDTVASITDALAVSRQRWPARRHTLVELCEHYAVGMSWPALAKAPGPSTALTRAWQLAQVWPHVAADVGWQLPA